MHTPHTPRPEESPSPNPETRPADNHPDYPQWLCQQVGARLKQRRGERTAMSLAVRGVLSDQTILNNESGKRNPGLATLARHCRRLGMTIAELFEGL